MPGIPPQTDTTSSAFLGNFMYLHFDPTVRNDLGMLKKIADFLLSKEHEDATERNLAVAGLDLNQKGIPRERVFADFLNDYLDYLIPRIVNLSDWRAGFEKHYLDFEKEYLSGRLTVECFGHLGNFAYKFEDRGVLNDHTAIVCLANLESKGKYEHACNRTADYYRIRSAMASTVPRMDENKISVEPYFFHYTYNVEKSKRAGGLILEAHRIMQKLVLGARLVLPSSRPYCDFVAAFHLGRMSRWGHPETLYLPENQISAPSGYDTLGEPETTWLRRLWARMENMDFGALVAFNHHLDDSLRRTSRELRNPLNHSLCIVDELDRLSDYFSAFDSIYETPSRNAGKYIADWTAELCAQCPSQGCEGLRQLILQMWNIRNHYRHGRFAEAVRTADNIESFRGKVSIVGRRLRHACMLFVMNDDFRAKLSTPRRALPKFNSVYY